MTDAEKKRARTQRWREENPEKARESARKSDAKRRARKVARQNERYATDPAFRQNRIENARAWRAKGPDGMRVQTSRRRARRYGAEGTHTKAEWVAKVAAYGGKCHWCGQTPAVMCCDHVVPLSRGGSNAIENVVPCCGQCNSRKGTKLPDEFTEAASSVTP